MILNGKTTSYMDSVSALKRGRVSFTKANLKKGKKKEKATSLTIKIITSKASGNKVKFTEWEKDY
jgi:hypothetical protein